MSDNTSVENLEEAVYSLVGQLETGRFDDIDTEWANLESSLYYAINDAMGSFFDYHIDFHDENRNSIHEIKGMLRVVGKENEFEKISKDLIVLIGSIEEKTESSSVESFQEEDDEFTSDLEKDAAELEKDFFTFIEKLGGV